VKQTVYYSSIEQDKVPYCWTPFEDPRFANHSALLSAFIAYDVHTLYNKVTFYDKFNIMLNKSLFAKSYSTLVTRSWVFRPKITHSETSLAFSLQQFGSIGQA